MKSFALFIFGLNSSLFGQDQIHRTELSGGKLKYEYIAVRERQPLVTSFFVLYDQLYEGTSKQFVITEGSSSSVARITKKGFEIVGDATDQRFNCEMAEILIDLWYEYSHKNSQ